jgi:hypothetical protein
MKTNADIIQEYKKLRSMYYDRDIAIKITIETIIESDEYKSLKDSICEQCIKNLINTAIPPSTF